MIPDFASTRDTSKVFFRVEPLALPTENRHMKIRADGILIDIDVSLSSQTLSSFYLFIRKRHCIVVTWVAYDEFITEYCMF